MPLLSRIGPGQSMLSISTPSFLLGGRGGGGAVPNFEKGGSEKNECLGGLKEKVAGLWFARGISTQADTVNGNFEYFQ